ncbi:MAG: exodeoxyribonuclease VII large subunit [Candidatus Eremiobacteraeota bacterium]|nr:exodeoxyribonuclease VII large subunit [Candidatus Eremiobacteraeota bacterium]MBC5827212.1 exodeoxyribonuclease VII large subunit [Candidatus Eremiobacteraeota bacterium]
MMLPLSEPVLTVGQLWRALKVQLDRGFPTRVWVKGEVWKCKPPSSGGHVYFDLKDQQAQIACVCWRSSVLNLRLHFPLDDGACFEVYGRVTTYPQRSQYQLVVDDIVPAGRGELYRRFEILRDKLKAEGLFDDDRKRPLPSFMGHVAIITSRDGAALHDFVTTCRRRGSHVRITFVHAAVQGDAAEAELARAIRFAGTLHADAIVLARGGGSIEDLWAFNTEAVARAIVACPTPIISAVGHETDFTIADFVADARAATPTAAAELVTRERALLLATIATARRRLANAAARILTRSQERLERIDATLRRPPQWILLGYMQRLDELVSFLERSNPRRRLGDSARRLSQGRTRVAAGVRRCLVSRTARLNALQAQLSTLAPQHTLRRGYAIVYGEGEQIISAVGQVVVDDSICVLVHDGRLRAAVKAKEPMREQDIAR